MGRLLPYRSSSYEEVTAGAGPLPADGEPVAARQTGAVETLRTAARPLSAEPTSARYAGLQ